MKKVVTAITTTTIALTGAATVDAAEDYEIVKRDTLWGISQQYNMTVEKLMEQNGLKASLIHPGQKLTVSDASDKEEVTEKSDVGTYTVVSGDTLSEIASEYNVNYKEIMEWNDLSSTLIFPGDTLKIHKGATEGKAESKPTKSKKEAVSSDKKEEVVPSTPDKKEEKAEKKATESGENVEKEVKVELDDEKDANETEEKSATANNGTHKIVAGETLSEIAFQYDVSFDKLMEWNNLSSTLIFPGQTLTINEKQAGTESTEQKSETVKKEEEVDSEPEAKEESSQPKTEEVAPKQEVEAEKTEEVEKPKEEATKPKEEVEQAPAEDKNTSSEQDAKTMTVEATAYTAECEGCTGITATGIDLNVDRNKKVIAVDPNVIPLGTKVYVEGYGTAIAGDVGGAIKGNKIDLHVPTKEEAFNWGRRTINITILD